MEGTLYVHFDNEVEQRLIAVVKPDHAIRWAVQVPNTTKQWKDSFYPRRKKAIEAGESDYADHLTECKHLVRHLEHIFMLQADREIPVGLLQAYYESPAYQGTEEKSDASEEDEDSGDEKKEDEEQGDLGDPFSRDGTVWGMSKDAPSADFSME
jgi:hypothetical protein